MLRVANGGRPIRTESEAQKMLTTYRACAASVGTPNAYEVVRVPGGYGVVVDYVVGLGMEVHLFFGTYTPEELGHAMAELLRRLHATHMEVGSDWNELFRTWAAAIAPLVPDGLGERLVALVEAVPRRHALLHGDFHVGNVILSSGVLTPIDMEYAGFGHPVFELALARSRLVSNVRAIAEHWKAGPQALRQSARELWDAMLEGYFEGASPLGFSELNRRIDVLSTVERCWFAYSIPRTGSQEVNERRRALVASYVDHLRELLPHVDRLDF